MSGKPVIRRKRADRDVEEAIEHDWTDAGEEVAFGFLDALERAFRHIERHPAAGSPRYAHELNLPGLRAWRLRRYPYLVFYVERDDHIDVWRVMHGERDIPKWMREPGSG